MKTQKFWKGWGCLVVMTTLFLLVSCAGGGGGGSTGGADRLDTETIEALRNQDGTLCDLLPGSDCDGDGVNDDLDLDIDGDGLIEVENQMELAAIHYVLNGTGRRFSEEDIVNVSGCGSCRGYELINDIPLSYNNSAGWQPLGGGADLRGRDRSEGGILGGRSGQQPYCVIKRGNVTVEAEGFDGTFEGNGFMISNLNINLPDRRCVGLFAKAKGEIRNLYIEGDRIIGEQLVGAVVGDGSFATIRDVHGRIRMLSGQGNSTVGGLVGSLYRGSLINSISITPSLTGNGIQTGGLVGATIFSNISDSAAMTTNITGGNTTHSIGVALGGLVGYCEESAIANSFSIAERIKSISSQLVHGTGGLVGQCGGTLIQDSYALAGTIEGVDSNNDIHGKDIGGLVGNSGGVKAISQGRAAMINSYAITESINGSNTVGGLEGAGGGEMFSSFAITANLVSTGEAGGLQGDDIADSVWNSYAISGTIDSQTDQATGGLIAGLTNGEIVASYGIVHTFTSPHRELGGLAGTFDESSTMLSSYVIMANISDSSALGGLVGSVFPRSSGIDPSKIVASYGVGNVSSPGFYRALEFAGSEGELDAEVNIVSSYWDNLNGSREFDVLRNGSLAAVWTNGTEENLPDTAVWCDLNDDERINAAEKRDDNLIWDFGESMKAEYPIIRCTPTNPLGLGQDRWRRLEGGKPNIPDSAELKKLISDFRAKQRALFPQHIADQ